MRYLSLFELAFLIRFLFKQSLKPKVFLRLPNSQINCKQIKISLTNISDFDDLATLSSLRFIIRLSRTMEMYELKKIFMLNARRNAVSRRITAASLQVRMEIGKTL